MPGRSYAKIVADAGYESEENYAYLEENKQEAYEVWLLLSPAC
jgi:hypothetical protein